MGLSFADLLPDYRASLSDAANAFPGSVAGPLDVPPADPDADLKRHLRTAAAAISRDKRPRTLLGTLTLVPEQSMYDDVPADLLLTKAPAWGFSGCAPWDLPRPPLPSLNVVDTPAGRAISLLPAPRADQIAAFGFNYSYYYLALHTISDATGTLTETDLPLLMLRAQAEAMRELSFRNHNKPITLRAASGLGGGGASKNQTPPALFEMLMKEYRESA